MTNQQPQLSAEQMQAVQLKTIADNQRMMLFEIQKQTKHLELLANAAANIANQIGRRY